MLSSQMTLNEFFNYWQNMYRTGELKESTRQNEIRDYTVNLSNTIGQKPIEQIKPEDLKKTLENLSNINRQKVCKRILDNMYQRMIDNDIITSNPMKRFKIKIEHETIYDDEKKNKYLSIEERQKLLEGMKKSRFHDITAFILETGLRKGEAIALTWNDINGHIRINKSFNTTLQGLTTTKTTGSKRQLPLFEKAKAVLDKTPVSERVGNCFKNINSNAYTTVLAKTSKRILGYFITPHDLRHTFASYGLENGVAPKIMQNWLGHSSIQTTLNIYMHVSKQAENDAIEIMNKI